MLRISRQLILSLSIINPALTVHANPATPVAEHRTATVDGLSIFYREARPRNAPVIVLLHGFPSSSFMYRDLLPRLAVRYHVIAPDYPLFGDYRRNVDLYPQFQEMFRKHRFPMLIAWGKFDPFFTLAGARAYLRDIPDAELHLLDTGHFALETHSSEIAAMILDFLKRRVEPAALHIQSLGEEQARVANGMVHY